jgi:excisionase family DNA binding protein
MEKRDNWPTVMTADEACQLLRISRCTLYKLVRDEQIPAIWLSRRCLRFSRDALLLWMRALEVGEWQR